MQHISALRRFFSTRNICVLGLCVSWALGILCTIFASLMIREGGLRGLGNIGHGKPPAFNRFAFPLFANIAVAISTECMGYIHSVSLRWALWREKRFLSNLRPRLLNNTKKFWLHRWYTNALSFVSLIMSYAATSQIFPIRVDAHQMQTGHSRTIVYYFTDEPGLAVNGIALAGLGLGIIGQGVISAFCLFRSGSNILSWSSHPLKNLLACHHADQKDSPGPNSCALLTSASSPTSKTPSARPCSLGEIKVPAKRLISLIWFLFFGTVIWATTVIMLSFRDNPHPQLSFLATPQPGRQHIADVAILLSSSSYPYISSFLVISGLQACFTIGLHCAELLVSLSRERTAWHKSSITSTKASDKVQISEMQDTKHIPGSIKSALTSWQTMSLFVLKPVTHWLLGLSVTLWAQNQSQAHIARQHEGALIIMQAIPLFVLAVASLLLASFVTLLAWHEIKSAPKTQDQSIIIELHELVRCT
ncbi:hypothetical protein B0J14DRAFT_576051 [Halenospora varia]|nr:hypothetical protein B0J14DRAFT_576051 [Halenospora varia]